MAATPPLLINDLGKGSHILPAALAELGIHARGQVQIGLGLRAFGVADDDRPAAVGGLPDCDIERDLGEEIDAQLFSTGPGPAMGEDFRAVAAIGAAKIRHVLDHAQDRHIHLAEHVDRLARVEKGDVLRGGHDHRTGQRHALSHGQLGVTGSRRHVDHQHVEFAPIDITQHLLQGTLHHGAAPDHRRVLLDQKAHGHELDAIGLHGAEPVAIGARGPAAGTSHAWHGWAVDIGIEETHRETHGRKTHGEVDRGGGFTHPTLARGHGDDGLAVGHQRFLHLGATLIAHGRGGTGVGATTWRTFGGEHHAARENARQRSDRVLAGFT